MGQITAGAAPSDAAQSDMSQPGVQLGHHLLTHHRSRDLFVPQHRDDVWSRKVVEWDLAVWADPVIAAYLVSRACLPERISKGRSLPLILHAYNGNAMRVVTPESRLKEHGVIRFFSRPRVSNDNTYSELPFRTARYWPDYPSHLPARKRPANGSRHLSTGTNTFTATAASSS